MAYGLIIFGATVVCLLFAENLAKRRNLDVSIFWECSFWTLLFGIIGARLYHVIDFRNLYSQNPVSILFIWNGGLGIFGALILGVLTAAIFLSRKKQPVLKWLDIFALVLPLGQAIGRWGNYFNSELMPYALYESAASLGLFGALFLLSKKHEKPGRITFAYLWGYALIRFFLEPFRSTSWEISQVNVAQAVSAILAIVAIIGLWKTRERN